MWILNSNALTTALCSTLWGHSLKVRFHWFPTRKSVYAIPPLSSKNMGVSMESYFFLNGTNIWNRESKKIKTNKNIPTDFTCPTNMHCTIRLMQILCPIPFTHWPLIAYQVLLPFTTEMFFLIPVSTVLHHCWSCIQSLLVVVVSPTLSFSSSSTSSSSSFSFSSRLPTP